MTKSHILQYKKRISKIFSIASICLLKLSQGYRKFAWCILHSWGLRCRFKTANQWTDCYETGKNAGFNYLL